MSDFQQSLESGKVGESQIAGWLRSRGQNILPVYEVADGQYKGPAVYSSEGEVIVAPDMLCFGQGKTIWIEAKHKNAFTWHRKTQRFVTGIDLHHYEQYQKIMGLVDWPVWLLFLHRGGRAVDSPVSPSGLYGNDLKKLIKIENHRYENPHGHQKHGMVYWSTDSLVKLSDYPL